MNEQRKPYVTVTYGMVGWFAVKTIWVNEHCGYYDADQTGSGRYETQQEAESEARGWAQAEGLEFRPWKK